MTSQGGPESFLGLKDPLQFSFGHVKTPWAFQEGLRSRGISCAMLRPLTNLGGSFFHPTV